MIREIKDNSGFNGNYKEFSGLSTDAALYPDTSDWLVTITGDCTITVS